MILTTTPTHTSLPEDELLIGELAAHAGTSARALRYYEQKGLIKSERSYNGYRDYEPESITRVIQIRELLAAGLSVRAIKCILPCLSSARSIEFDDLDPNTQEMLEAERDSLSRRIASLTTSRDAMTEYLGRLNSRRSAPMAFHDPNDVPRETGLPANLAAPGERIGVRP